MPTKQDIADVILKRGDLILHVLTHKPELDVPLSLRGLPVMILHVGYTMPIPIPDLCTDAWGLHATLSFNRIPYKVRVPWDAVFLLSNAEGTEGAIWVGGEDCVPLRSMPGSLDPVERRPPFRRRKIVKPLSEHQAEAAAKKPEKKVVSLSEFRNKPRSGG